MEARGAQLSAERLVVQAAVAFLQGQRDLLRSGLDGATDDAVVADVTRRHDASHEAWVSTVGALRGHVSEDVVQQVIDLYGFHGRVAGGLAGERSMRLPGPIETGVRRILSDQLDQLTHQAVEQLRSGIGERGIVEGDTGA